MRTSFKNFRRSYLKEHKCKKSSTPSTRLRVYGGDEPEITEEEYQDAIRQLHGNEFASYYFILIVIALFPEEHRKGKKGSKHSIIKQLMEKTKARRHQWIQSEHPLVSEVLKTFPHLVSSRWVSM